MNVKMVFIGMLILSLVTGCGGQAPATEPAAVTETSAPAVIPSATTRPTRTPYPTPTDKPCIAKGDQNTINFRLRALGDTAVLCQGAIIQLTKPVIFTAKDQQIYTEGYPTDNRRAVLRIVSPDLATAIIMRDFDNATLSHIVVDGNRNNLGSKSGDALIYAGGSSSGQTIRYSKIMETRSWSAVHLIQGHPAPNPQCANALIEYNEIGPAGQSDQTWADGISLACTNSIIRNNLIVDATDGGIVIFGAPGSLIEGNIIRAETRTLLGGINMVDFGAYDGNYTGTIVRNNTIDADGAVIRIGLGMGTRVWGCLPLDAEDDTLYGGTVTGNTLRGEKMQYGYAVDGVRDWTVFGNVDEALHSGAPSVDCRGKVASVPAGFQYFPARALGTFQPEFQEAFLELALWAIIFPRPGQ